MTGRPGGRTPIDWQRARSRLEAGWAATLEALNPGAEASQRLLEERARALGQRTPAPDEAPRLDVLHVRLGDERWAMEASWVRRVLRLDEATPVPGAPPWLVGVVDLLGTVVPLADVRALLVDGAPAARDAAPYAVILGGSATTPAAWLGVVVDEAVGLGRLRVHGIGPPSAPPGRPLPTWVRGVTDESIVVLDAAALLDEPLLTVEVPR